VSKKFVSLHRQNIKNMAEETNVEKKEPQRKLVGKVIPSAGHSLFSLNLKTGEITNMGRPKQVDMEKDMVYRTALNKKNFVKRLIREGIMIKRLERKTKDNGETTE